MIDTSMTLSDGRVLAYTDCGDPNGALVIYFHGAPTSRLDLVVYDDAFAASGVRVVSPDRPGYGGSSPQPGRSWNDWPADVAALADALGVERFAVTGLSSGGPYVVATAALLGNRIAGATVVSGVTDMAWPDAWNGYLEHEAMLMRLQDEAKAAEWCNEHFGSDGAGFFESAGDMTPADMALLADEAMATAFFTTVGESFRQGVGGFAQDITVQGTPWSFDVRAITAPTTVVHGDADTIVPFVHGRHTAEMIAGAEFVALPGHGHLSPITEIPRFAAEMATSLR